MSGSEIPKEDLLPEREVEQSSLVTVGRLVGAHGIAGALKVFPLTDFPERFLSMKELRLFRSGGAYVRTVTVADVASLEGKGQFIVSTREIADRDEAERLRGLLVKVRKEERMPLPEGAFWIEDLLGMEVRDAAEDIRLGTLKNVLQTGAHDIYVLEDTEGKERMFPAVRDVVLRVDGKRRVMEVRIPEGLWEE